MEWTADVSAGDWLRGRLDADATGTGAGRSRPPTMHRFVPRGFAAYARIFHPATRSRPVDRPWPPLPYERNVRAWDRFADTRPEIDTEPVRWADTAASFGTTMHPLAQWSSLVRGTADQGPAAREGSVTERRAFDPNGWQQVQSPDGWQFDAPTEGVLDVLVLTVLAGHLAAATTTPGDGFVAVWEGWGGLVGHLGWGPSRVFFALSAESADADPRAAEARRRNRDMMAHSARDTFNDVFRKPSWQSGILPDDVSRGPRLELPDRGHVLFRGGVAEFADPDWMLRAPWRDREQEAHGFAPSAQSPSIVWPADLAWVLVTEVDLDSTVVGGSRELVRALCADARLEALPIPEGADLSSGGDEENP